MTRLREPGKPIPVNKAAIRNSACGNCGARPPFDDGSHCHPHRIRPELGYVEGNVVPRCPDCHSREPGHVPHLTERAYSNGCKGGLKRAMQLLQLTPEDRAALGRLGGRLGGLASKEVTTPEERSARARIQHPSKLGGLSRVELSQNGRKGGRVLVAARKAAGLDAFGRTREEAAEAMRRRVRLNPERQREIQRRGAQAVRAFHASLTQEERSARARNAGVKGNAAANHVRWHIGRGIVNPACPLCRESQ